MRRLALLLVFVILSGAAIAAILPASPYTFTNGTTADATQVNANFASIVSNTNANAMPYTANLQYSGGTSTGSANAQIVGSLSPPTGFNASVGQHITFTPGFSNTGATTLNVGGTGAFNVFKQTSGGPVALVGGEIVSGNILEAVFDGSEYQILSPNNNSLVPIGTVVDYSGSTAPTLWALAYGQAISRTTCGAYFILVGTTYGTGDGSTTFNVPDLRGRVAAGKDDMGGSAANRITNAVSGITGTTLGAAGGAQSQTLTVSQVPNLTVTGSVSSSFSAGQVTAMNVGATASGNSAGTVAVATRTVIANNVDLTINSSTVTGTVTSSFSAGTTSNGGGGAHPIVQPTIMLNKIIFTGC